MSFLEQLQQKRSNLQATSTVVTTITGERYLEHSDGKEKLHERSYGFVVDTKPDTVAACILDNFLYLGSQDAVTTDNINSLCITHLLSVGIDAPAIEDSNLVKPLLQHKFLPCLDLPETQLFGTDGVAQTAIDFIENARLNDGHVLVHCNAGVSRSASIILTYLMQKRHLSFEDAYTLIKTKRPCVQPNAGFLRQLKQYASV